MNDNVERQRARVKVDPTFEAMFKDVQPEEYEQYKKEQKEEKALESKSNRTKFIKKFGLVLLACLLGLLFFIAVLLPAGSALATNLNIFGLSSQGDQKSIFQELPGFEMGESVAEQLNGANELLNNASKGWENFNHKVNKENWSDKLKNS